MIYKIKVMLVYSMNGHAQDILNELYMWLFICSCCLFTS